MSKQQLAILGGKPIIDKPLVKYNHIGIEEAQAVENVLRSGVLSDFVGSDSEYFYGGRMVREFEARWRERFGVRHAITMNSATSCLAAAVGAAGVGPGDEVIVSPFTMSASAMAILTFNAIPVFADIEPETFNLDPDSIEKRLTSQTRALMVPNIFGHSADYGRILEIARKHNLVVIEDNAQSPTSRYKGKLTGTIGDIGVFSLNRHKHIHTGEGGVCVTDNNVLAERLCLIRNHGEVVADQRNLANLVNLIGFNFRLGEIEAAIGIEQLKKMDRLVESRIHIADHLTSRLSGINGLEPPKVQKDCTHVYYVYPMKYDSAGGSLHRNKIVRALQAEGVPLTEGYTKPLYLQSIYQKRIAYGEKGCPFTCDFYGGNVDYEKGLCPTAETMHEDILFLYEPCKYEPTDDELNLLADAFDKVFSQRNALNNMKEP